MENTIAFGLEYLHVVLSTVGTRTVGTRCVSSYVSTIRKSGFGLDREMLGVWQWRLQRLDIAGVV